MADRPQFGKRRPQRLPDLQREPAPKRSRHVALLVMGAFAVGGGAYAMMERPNCQPTPTTPGVAAPAAPGMVTPLSQRGGCISRESSYSGHSTRYGFFSSGSSGNSYSSRSSGSDSASGSVSRGGFGSLAHAFGFGSS